MATDLDHGALTGELTALGRAAPGLAADHELVAAVMSRLPEAAGPAPAGRWQHLAHRARVAFTRHRRRTAVGLAVLLVSSLAASPVRAAVAEWFGFAGVIVRQDPAPDAPVSPRAPGVAAVTDLQEAKGLVAFAPVAPAALGPPQGVEVSADRRVLSLSWTVEGPGVVRVDQFDGRLDYVFAKTAPGVQFTAVAGAFALWFEAPHEVVVLDREGHPRTETARLSGQTLIWEDGPTTLRLEGDLDLATAIRIAESTVPVP